jgi:hypothetical protein
VVFGRRSRYRDRLSEYLIHLVARGLQGAKTTSRGAKIPPGNQIVTSRRFGGGRRPRQHGRCMTQRPCPEIRKLHPGTGVVRRAPFFVVSSQGMKAIDISVSGSARLVAWHKRPCPEVRELHLGPRMARRSSLGYHPSSTWSLRRVIYIYVRHGAYVNVCVAVAEATLSSQRSNSLL